MRLRHTSLTLVVLAAAAALLYSATKHDQSLSGIGALWEWLAEGQREISRLPMAMTRLPDDEEVAVGGRLAATEQLGSLHRQYTYSAADLVMEENVRRVGSAMARRARRPLAFTFYYLPNSSFFNAYALPGGHIVIGKGLARQFDREDMLAAVIGHEIEHVDRYHCAERYQIAARVGKLVALPVTLFQAGYTKEQELEADREGTLLAVRSGYSAAAAARLFEIFERLDHDRERRAPDPVSEISSAALQSVSEYFRTHPPAAERKRQIEQLIARQHFPAVAERPLPAEVPSR